MGYRGELLNIFVKVTAVAYFSFFIFHFSFFTSYMFAMISSPNSEHFNSVAPSIRR